MHHTNNTRSTTVDRAIVMREDRRDGGWSEIGIWIRRPNTTWSSNKIGAVVTHPHAKAKWFVYSDKNGREACKTRHEAVKRAIEIARSLPEYKAAIEAP